MCQEPSTLCFNSSIKSCCQKENQYILSCSIGYEHKYMSRSRKVVFGYSSAIVAAALFGSVPTVAKPVLTNINPILLSSLVYLVSGATFTPLAYRSKKKTVHRKYYVLVIMTGIIGAAIAPVLFFQGLKQTTAGDTSLLANGETVFSILFALLLFGEKLNTKVYLAIILILAGLFIVTTNLKFDSTILNLNSGNILVIGATVLWGLDNNISKIITRHMEIARVVQLKSLVGGGILLIVVLAGGLPLTIQYNQILPIIIVGVLGIAFSLFLYLQAIKKIGVAKSSSILSLSAVFGLAFAGIFLAEQISHYQLIAIIVMFVGVYMMYKSEEKKMQSDDKCAPWAQPASGRYHYHGYGVSRTSRCRHPHRQWIRRCLMEGMDMEFQMGRN
jgi:drug/metabolite transporter (DMT)-like permease